MISCCSCWWGPVWPEPGGLKQFHNPGDFLLIGIMKPITNIKSHGLKRQTERSRKAHGPRSTHPAPQGRRPPRLQVSGCPPGTLLLRDEFCGVSGGQEGGRGWGFQCGWLSRLRVAHWF